MDIRQINQLDIDRATHLFMQCCTSQRWIKKMVTGRPYHNFADLSYSADQFWSQMTEQDYLQAFEGHPKIGDINSLHAKYANTKELAFGEQAGASQASEELISALADSNQTYEKKYGFIFIVCASGKTAEEMLVLLDTRLKNDRRRELEIASEEQRKILQLRLEKLL